MNGVLTCKVGPSSGACFVTSMPVQVESPSCIWGRFVQDPGSGTDQYDRLQAQMNLFYKDVTQDLRHLKPTSLEEGQVTQHLWSAVSLSSYTPDSGAESDPGTF